MLADTLQTLLDVYAYSHAYRIAKQNEEKLPSEFLFLLMLLKERRDLNIDVIFEHESDLAFLGQDCPALVLHNSYQEELLANYILDLEAKVRNESIIDFVRSVSPILYRLMLGFAQKQLPDLEDYIHNSKNEEYDRWLFGKIKASSNLILQSFASQWQSPIVNTSSLLALLEQTDIDQSDLDLLRSLRQFEKSIRNPLAHLIKAFDEEELYRTTSFSAQTFLDHIIILAQKLDVHYQTDKFYFDEVNEYLVSLLEV